MSSTRLQTWLQLAAAWAVMAGLVVATAAIVSAQQPVVDQARAAGQPGDGNGGRRGPFTDELVNQLAANLNLPPDTVRDALQQVQDSGRLPGPPGGEGRPGFPGQPFDPAGGPPPGFPPPGAFPGGPPDPAAVPGGPPSPGMFPGGPPAPGAFPGGPPDPSAFPGGPPGSLRQPGAGPGRPFQGALAAQLAAALNLPVETVQIALDQTFAQLPPPFPGDPPSEQRGPRGFDR